MISLRGEFSVNARLAFGGHRHGGAGLQQQGFQFIRVAEARAFGTIAPRDGVQQGQRLMNDLAFVRGPAGANVPLDDGFVVIGAGVAHVIMVIYWQMLSMERDKMKR